MSKLTVVAAGRFAETELCFCNFKLARIWKVQLGVQWVDIGRDEGTAGGESHWVQRELEGKCRKQAFSDLSQRGHLYAGWEAV